MISRPGDQAYLHPKLDGHRIPIPQAGEDHVPLLESHERLSCDACHAQWVPRCLGCHLEYDPDGEQWDHLEQQVTPGRWKEKRWDTDAGEPVLGVLDQETIDTFVPGMILTATHPSLEEPLFRRRFARLSPHTTAKARGCESCHRSSSLLGLGSGKPDWKGEALHFTPSVRKLRDGLPMDAWTCLDDCDAFSAHAFSRPLFASEIMRILGARKKLHPVPMDMAREPARTSLSELSGSEASPDIIVKQQPGAAANAALFPRLWNAPRHTRRGLR